MKCLACAEEIVGDPHDFEHYVGYWCSEECKEETDRIRDLNARSYYGIKYGMTIVRGSDSWVDPDTGNAKLHWTTGPIQGSLL